MAAASAIIVADVDRAVAFYVEPASGSALVEQMGAAFARASRRDDLPSG